MVGGHSSTPRMVLLQPFDSAIFLHICTVGHHLLPALQIVGTIGTLHLSLTSRNYRGFVRRPRQRRECTTWLRCSVA